MVGAINKVSTQMHQDATLLHQEPLGLRLLQLSFLGDSMKGWP